VLHGRGVSPVTGKRVRHGQRATGSCLERVAVGQPNRFRQLRARVRVMAVEVEGDRGLDERGRFGRLLSDGRDRDAECAAYDRVPQMSVHRRVTYTRRWEAASSDLNCAVVSDARRVTTRRSGPIWRDACLAVAGECLVSRRGRSQRHCTWPPQSWHWRRDRCIPLHSRHKLRLHRPYSHQYTFLMRHRTQGGTRAASCRIQRLPERTPSPS
jgi:hypothetical protein